MNGVDERIKRVAAANASAYDAGSNREYIDGAPHIKHAALRKLYGKLVVEVFDRARTRQAIPKVLDLGAGEGSVTLPFLQLGAEVTAVDISRRQLDALREKCKEYHGRLTTRCEDIHETLKDESAAYDIIVANSFLHHVPDYLGMIREAAGRLTAGGQFFSFQDPLKYDTVGPLSTAFCQAAYYSWRIFRGDLIGGFQRRLRRARGIYLDDSPHDNAEYHATRGGVDQTAVCELLQSLGFDFRFIPYYSTQSRLFQPIGTALGVRNTFAVVARKP
jgi:SAM-dependent methyltransferase